MEKRKMVLVAVFVDYVWRWDCHEPNIWWLLDCWLHHPGKK